MKPATDEIVVETPFAEPSFAHEAVRAVPPPATFELGVAQLESFGKGRPTIEPLDGGRTDVTDDAEASRSEIVQEAVAEDPIKALAEMQKREEEPPQASEQFARREDHQGAAASSDLEREERRASPPDENPVTGTESVALAAAAANAPESDLELQQTIIRACARRPALPQNRPSCSTGGESRTGGDRRGAAKMLDEGTSLIRATRLCAGSRRRHGRRLSREGSQSADAPRGGNDSVADGRRPTRKSGRRL
ncbi:MAG: hypothetical protein WKF30_08495 [Pyrinomonadaceae bacterium]